MDWKTVLNTIAPTVASAVLGPLGGVAVSALGKIFGVDAATTADLAKVFQDGKMTPDQLSAIKLMEMQYQNDEKERNFKYSELEFKDRDSARTRESTVKDDTNKNIAYFIVVAFVLMVVGTLLGYAVVDSALAGTLVGYLSAKCEQVLAYYFGSSRGSERKTELLAQSEAIK